MVTYCHESDTNVGQQSVNALCVDRISDKHKKLYECAYSQVLYPNATQIGTSNHSLSPAAIQ